MLAADTETSVSGRMKTIDLAERLLHCHQPRQPNDRVGSSSVGCSAQQQSFSRCWTFGIGRMAGQERTAVVGSAKPHLTASGRSGRATAESDRPLAVCSGQAHLMSLPSPSLPAMDHEAEALAANSPCRRCEHCRFGEMSPSTWAGCGYGVSCRHPRLPPGQAGVGKNCCYFEREPGSDDELERLPPMWRCQ